MERDHLVDPPAILSGASPRYGTFHRTRRKPRRALRPVRSPHQAPAPERPDDSDARQLLGLWTVALVMIAFALTVWTAALFHYSYAALTKGH